MSDSLNISTMGGGLDHPEQYINNTLAAALKGALAGLLQINGLTGGTRTLSADEAKNVCIELAGTLTSNLIVVVPTSGSSRKFQVRNFTTGAYTVTVTTAATGSQGVTLKSGQIFDLWHNGTHVFLGWENNLDRDDFNRANSASALGYSLRGRAWSIVGGTWGIQSNQAYLVTSAGTNANAAVLETGQADATVRSTFATNASGAGLVGRVTDINNLLLVNWDGTVYTLYKRVAGSFTSLGTWTGGASGDVVELEMHGSSLVVRVNGTQRISATDSFNSTATKHGIFSGGTTTPRWEDFEVR